MGTVGRLSPEEVRAWLERSCRLKGCRCWPRNDPGTLARVGVLLGGKAWAPAQAKRRGGDCPLQPPDGLDPVRVHVVNTVGAGVDDDAVDHGADDGDLSAQVEGLPLRA